MSELMDVILACENQLGWSGPTSDPLWKARAAGYSRLRAALSRSEPKPTIAELHLAIAYCRRRRQPITSPAELIGLVKVAKELAATPETPSTLAVGIEEAISWERERGDEHSSRWIRQLTRATGPVRADVLAEWAETRGE